MLITKNLKKLYTILTTVSKKLLQNIFEILRRCIQVKVFWAIKLLFSLTGGYQHFGEMFASIFSVEVWTIIFEISEADPQEEGRFP